jgi:membrane protein
VALLPVSEADRLAAQHKALLLAAQVRLRTAQEAREKAPWYRGWAADRAVREAQEELEQVEAATPAVVPARGAVAAARGGVAAAPAAGTPGAPRA